MTLSHRSLVLPILLVGLIPRPSRGVTTLEWKNPLPQGNAIWGVDFESATVGYAVGDRGSVLRTTDGGSTWSDLTDRQVLDVSFNELEVIAPGVLVSVTLEGEIFRSTDGGESWMSIVHPGTEPLRELAYVDGVLTALGRIHEVLRSSDGGLTWSLVADPGGTELKGQYWFDASHGIVVGGDLAAETTDGGATWTPLPDIDASGFPNSLDDIDFVGDEGVIVGEFSRWRTHDGGASWEENGDFSSPIYQRRVFLFDPTTWIVFTDSEGANIDYTTDDGATWTTPVMRFDVAGFNDAVRLPGGGFMAVTTAGDLFRGTTDGLVWSNATLDPDDGPRITIDALGDRPDGTLFAAGAGAFSSGGTRWLRSDDAGETWVAHEAIPTLETVYDIEFLTDDFGIAGGYGPGGVRVARTLDGGATWTSHPLSSTNGFVTGVAIFDPDVAIVSVVGETNGLVERSVDGGVTWAPSPAGAERMECVAVASGDTAYAGGGGFSVARIFRTVDAGATWTQVAGAGLPSGRVDAMTWIDGHTGLCAVSRVPMGIYRTTDAGATWSLVQEGYIRELDGKAGVVAAGGYDIDDFHLSTDGGVTWTPGSLPSTIGVGALLVRGDRVVAGGYGSSIMTGTIEGVVATPDAAGTPAPGLALDVRPLGAGARIDVILSAPGELDVAIYDVQGRRLRTLATGPRRVGPQHLRWDGRDASGREVGSGVVWVRAVSNGREAVHRLVRAR